MTSLESLTVGLALVLGLASALVLTSGLAVLRARTDVRVDWVPVLWALYIFVSQMQHWWAFFRLSRLEAIPAAVFGLMLLRPVLLFVAGGLVLPPNPDRFRGDLREYFEKDGRWGVLAYATYWLVVPFGNMLGLNLSVASPPSASAIALLALAVWVFAVRRTRTTATILFGVALTVNTLVGTEALRSIMGWQPWS